ncbi:MAG: hypothetical protein VZQ28_01365 [Methanomethylophilus sp.]|nr:hypothetical protein [Methanomethylophilus sp.]
MSSDTKIRGEIPPQILIWLEELKELGIHPRRADEGPRGIDILAVTEAEKGWLASCCAEDCPAQFTSAHATLKEARESIGGPGDYLVAWEAAA